MLNRLKHQSAAAHGPNVTSHLEQSQPKTTVSSFQLPYTEECQATADVDHPAIRKMNGMSQAGQQWAPKAQLTLKQACSARQVCFTRAFKQCACNIVGKFRERQKPVFSFRDEQGLLDLDVTPTAS